MNLQQTLSETRKRVNGSWRIMPMQSGHVTGKNVMAANAKMLGRHVFVTVRRDSGAVNARPPMPSQLEEAGRRALQSMRTVARPHDR
jgi:hypothetical protein